MALKETVLKDKKATTEYWQSVAADLRKDIDKIRADAIADRKENQVWRKRATRSFNYLCQRVMKVDPAGVEIARGMWDGTIDVPEFDDDDITEVHS